MQKVTAAYLVFNGYVPSHTSVLPIHIWAVPYTYCHPIHIWATCMHVGEPMSMDHPYRYCSNPCFVHISVRTCIGNSNHVCITTQLYTGAQSEGVSINDNMDNKYVLGHSPCISYTNVCLYYTIKLNTLFIIQ